MASHFTASDAAPRIAQLDATLCDLVYGNDAVAETLLCIGAKRHVVLVSGELIALESGALWLDRRRRRRQTNFLACVQTMMRRTCTNVCHLPRDVALMCGFAEAVVLLDDCDDDDDDDSSTIMVREYMYNSQTRARMYVTEKIQNRRTARFFTWMT